MGVICCRTFLVLEEINPQINQIFLRLRRFNLPQKC